MDLTSSDIQFFDPFINAIGKNLIAIFTPMDGVE